MIAFEENENFDPTLQLDDLGGGVVRARICRPPNNFFDEPLIAMLAITMQKLGEDGTTRAVVLSSEGKNFCAGANFGKKRERSSRPLGIYDWALDLFESEIPIVAAVQGAAVGGGVGLALAADLRVGTASTRLSLNFARLGMNQGFAITETLKEVVGEQRALELLITARKISGEEAHSIGLLDQLVPEDELEDAAIDRARAIAVNAPLAVRAIRNLVRGGRIQRLRHVIEREVGEQTRLMATDDFREGVRSSASSKSQFFRESDL